MTSPKLRNRLAAWLWHTGLGDWWMDLCVPVWSAEAEAEMLAETEAETKEGRVSVTVEGLRSNPPSLPF